MSDWNEQTTAICNHMDESLIHPVKQWPKGTHGLIPHKVQKRHNRSIVLAVKRIGALRGRGGLEGGFWDLLFLAYTGAFIL